MWSSADFQPAKSISSSTAMLLKRTPILPMISLALPSAVPQSPNSMISGSSADTICTVETRSNANLISVSCKAVSLKWYSRIRLTICRLGYAMGRGKIRHRNFKAAAGEMSPAEFTHFLEQFIRQVIAFSIAGSIHYIFMDWRHLQELLNAARPLYTEFKNLLIWNKDNAGQGSFYRSKHELIAVF